MIRLTPPRIATVLLSLVLAALAVASLRVHIPAVGPFVAAHRFWMMAAAYGVLGLGVLLRGL